MQTVPRILLIMSISKCQFLLIPFGEYPYVLPGLGIVVGDAKFPQVTHDGRIRPKRSLWWQQQETREKDKTTGKKKERKANCI